MRKIGKALILIAMLVTLFTTQVCAAEKVDINTLIEKENRFDKSQVTVQGEAIGEPMERSGGECWVNINDGTNAIGIKMKTADARRIAHYGSYKQTGDTVRVTGTFYKACGEDGGETDIHAVSLQVVSAGKATQERVRPAKIFIAVLLAASTAFCLALFQKTRTARRH